MLRKLVSRVSAFLNRRDVDQEIEEELRFHLEMQARAAVERGLSRGEAEYAAALKMDGLEQTKEAVRDIRRTPLDSTFRDVRYALRTFRRNPTFTVIAVITLAIGIGATASIFSVADATLFRPLPYHSPDRIVRMINWDPRTGREAASLSRDVYNAFQTARTIDSVSSYMDLAVDAVTLVRNEGVQVFHTCDVSSSFFRVIGVQPLLGRGFRPEEEIPGRDGVAVLSYASWQRLGGDPGIVGRQLNFKEGKRTVIGVMPRDFWYPAISVSLAPDILVPDVQTQSRNNFFLIARLGSDVTLQQAQAEADLIASRTSSAADRNQGAIRVLTLHDYLTESLRRNILLLLGAVGTLLLIACLNVANLLLARAGSREQELALRAALGAGRSRLFCQLFTETVLLSIIGGAAGALLAIWMLKLLLLTLPGRFQIVPDIGIDSRVLLFVLAITAASNIVFGLWPAIAASSVNLTERLKMRLGRQRASRRPFGSVLLVAESALAMILLVGAGLMVNTFVRLQTIDYGFETTGLWYTVVRFDQEHYPDSASIGSYYNRMTTVLREVPGVMDVAAADYPPLFGGLIGGFVELPDRPPLDRGSADVRHVSAGYFGTIGMSLVQGRLFVASDERAAPNVVVINQSMANRFWPGQQAVGRTIIVDKKWPVEIVGIVRDVCESPARNAAFNLYVSKPAVYVPLGDLSGRALPKCFLVRTSPWQGDRMAQRLHQKAAILDANQAVEFSEYKQRLERGFAHPRFFAFLLGFFGTVALLLAAVGVGGITAYSVSRRTYEMGVRMALGAGRSHVVSAFVRCVLISVTIGLAIGAVAAASLSRVIESLLFQITPTDPMTFAAVTVVLAMVALAASWLPARRAASIDPLVALKSE